VLRPSLAILLVLAAATTTAAPERNPLPDRPVTEAPIERLIVKLRPAAGARATAQAAPADAASAVRAEIDALGARTGVLLVHTHSITAEIHVARLFQSQQGAALEATLARLRADAAVAYADPDRRRYAHAVPNDPLFSGTPGQAGQTGQWYLQAPVATPAGTTTAAVNAVGAWPVTTGSTGVVIADLDTGVRFDHPDLQTAAVGGRLLPGYDFVGCDGGGSTICPTGSTYYTANDGNGWDSDPSDPGDWIDANDLKKSVFSAGCTQGGSSWHGTRTAGLLAAITNNGVGIAALSWDPWLVPVRVLGKCGGYDSDIIAAMLWAAGIAVSGAPANPYPARILNMSLGATGSCSSSYHDAIAQVGGRGAAVVVSAGNEGGPIDEPANCPGAIAVVGVRHVGTKVGYSSLGQQAALAAPAGNCVNTAVNSPCLFSIDTTTNDGATTPGSNGYTDQMNPNIGTSFSAPIVSGIAALMLSVNGNLTPAQLRTRLRNAADPFPHFAMDTSSPPQPIPMCYTPAAGDTSQTIECNCSNSGDMACGAGLADAAKSVGEALRPIAALAAPAATSPGQSVGLDASGSAAACGRTVASYAWSIIGSPPGTPSLSATTGPQTTLNAAPTSGTITVQLVVTDDQGATDTATIVVGSSTTTTTAPASAGASACLASVAPPAPAVTISVSPSPVTVGQSATVSWSATNASSCTASGAWSGAEATSGSQSVTPSAAGSSTYSISCAGAGGNASGAATLTVNAAPARQGGGGGGGAADFWSLGLGALLGLAARRRTARRA
jgi:serine protease